MPTDINGGFASQCDGKRPFASRPDAMLIISKMRGRKNIGCSNGGVKTYLCQLCGSWHIGGEFIERERVFPGIAAPLKSPNKTGILKSKFRKPFIGALAIYRDEGGMEMKCFVTDVHAPLVVNVAYVDRYHGNRDQYGCIIQRAVLVKHQSETTTEDDLRGWRWAQEKPHQAP